MIASKYGILLGGMIKEDNDDDYQRASDETIPFMQPAPGPQARASQVSPAQLNDSQPHSELEQPESSRLSSIVVTERANEGDADKIYDPFEQICNKSTLADFFSKFNIKKLAN